MFQYVGRLMTFADLNEDTITRIQYAQKLHQALPIVYACTHIYMCSHTQQGATDRFDYDSWQGFVA